MFVHRTALDRISFAFRGAMAAHEITEWFAASNKILVCPTSFVWFLSNAFPVPQISVVLKFIQNIRKRTLGVSFLHVSIEAHLQLAFERSVFCLTESKFWKNLHKSVGIMNHHHTPIRSPADDIGKARIFCVGDKSVELSRELVTRGSSSWERFCVRSLRSHHVVVLLDAR